MSKLLDVAIADIRIPEDRARPLDGGYAEGLAVMIEAEGLIQPITVRQTGETYELIAGLHRLSACIALIWETIPSLIREADDTDAALFETLENLARNELSPLDRARHFSRFKDAYEAKYGAVERGGDRRSQTAKDQSADTALWSFHETIADRTGFSRRTVFAYVAVWQGLDPDQYERLCTLPQISGNFSQLKALSDQNHDVQDQVLGLIEGDSDANTVADALTIIADGRLARPADKVMSRAVGAFSRLNQDQRFSLFDSLEADIRAYAVERGWVAG